MPEENVDIARRMYPGNIDMVAVMGNPELLRATREGIEPYVDPEFETVGPRTQSFGRGRMSPSRGVLT